MSIFGDIMSKVFGGDHPAAQTPPASGDKPPADTSAAPPTTTAGEKSDKSNTWEQAPTNANAQQSGKSPTSAPTPVDVAAKLDAMPGAAQTNWRTSIADLMQLLGLDNSLTARRELAKELHYTGDTHDTYDMNVWLHKQVMTKIAENGGKLPDDLKHA